MTAMQIVRKIARRQFAVRQFAEDAAVARALWARNEYIRDAVSRLSPQAQAIVIESYARAYPDDAS